VTSLAWSPDGAGLVVTARAEGTPAADVYSVALDGTHVRRLTTNLDARDVSGG
jgi:Tol biopolymer transport system component